ncbi:hypothetical protein BKA70DRAFT_1141197 [Coprinopsis sp. MPI-PUGE-AT-0042]|nr:hypothetical protein BKA70DRAFT_1141197 [Coprinopsis sp. MPI-PUGE-AT-0042]
MHVPGLLLPRQGADCIQCPAKPQCACNNAVEECVIINRDCTSCARMECIPKAGAGGGSKGVSKGALAGGIIGALLFLALAVGAYLWYRRTSARNKAEMSAHDVKDIPAPAETVLNRPDPIEKPPVTPYSDLRTPQTSRQPSYDDRSETSHSLGPHQLFARNPFDDANSIQTAASEGTNVIPIALVGPESHRASLKSEESAASSGPVRPPRSPDLDLGLNHVNVSHGNLRPEQRYPPSTVSGVSGISAYNRNSYMSNMTSASEMLNEAPVIMTPMKGSVLGVVKAEVVSTKTLSSSSSSDTLRVPAMGRPAATSPLAATSFGPNDVVPEADESQEINPFDDKHSSTHANFSMSPPPTASTFRTSNMPAPNANLTWMQGSQDDGASRPVSMATQAGSVIDIGSATRVNVGLGTPATARAYRTTMGRLVSPNSAGSSPGTLEEQQAWALAHAQAQAQAQGLDKPRPVSGSSAISATADSILESFPFVPPSPISNRPIRSPPVSPLGQQTFSGGATSPLGQHTFVVAPPSPRTGDSFSQNNQGMTADDDRLPAPPNRRTLGLSTGSQLSTASSGLGSFPFQIDNGADTHDAPPPAFQGRQRASLDTLALTSDLSSYPLGFDRDGGAKNKRR